MRRKRIVIVGGGIAGMAAAAFLGRDGHEVVVLERARRPRTSGSPVDLRGGALDAVEALGLGEELRAADTGVRRMRLVDAAGRRIADVRLRSRRSRDIELSRTTLGRALARAAAEVAEVRFGAGPAAIAATAGGATVELPDGDAVEADVVIGADGQHSTVRRLLWGSEERFARPIGLAIATLPAAPDDDPGTLRMHAAPGLSLAVHPAGGAPVAAFLLRTAPGPAPATRAEWEDLLRHRYAGMGWRAPELLAGLSAADDLYADAVTRVRTPSWSAGRVALLGDAASSVTILGEGSSMAVVGARTLSAALRGEADIPTALGAYERRHRPEVERRQRGARGGAALLVPATAAGLALRNAAARLAP